MNWQKLFEVTEQIKQIPKIGLMVKNPVKFFQKNKDKEEEFLVFATLITRLSLIIDFITKTITNLFEVKPVTTASAILIYITLFIFAPVLAWLVVKISGFFTNLFAVIFAKKNDYLAAQRVVAYSSVAELVPDLPFLSIVGIIFYFVLEIIGIAKQYKISYPLSAVISIVPGLLLITFLLLFLILMIILTGAPLTGEAIKGLWL